MRLSNKMLVKALSPPHSSGFCILALTTNTTMCVECTIREREAEIWDSLFGKGSKRESSQERRGSVELGAVSQHIAETTEPEHGLWG